MGNGIGADKHEFDDAKDAIIALIVGNFNGVFDDQKILWSTLPARVRRCLQLSTMVLFVNMRFILFESFNLTEKSNYFIDYNSILIYE